MYNFLMICILFNIFSLVKNVCVPIEECPAAIKHITKRRNNPDSIRILRNAHCAYTVKNGQRTVTIDCDKVSNFDEKEDKLKLLDSDICGLQEITTKITSGQLANFEDHPWLALLQYKNVNNHLAYRCHGSLINSRYVVTAAHCLEYPNKDRIGSLFHIILGEHDVRTEKDCLPLLFGESCMDLPQIFTPESIHIHEEFGSKGAVSDIGLIRLNKKATFSEFVRPICLPFEVPPLNNRDRLLITGWGRTENNTMSSVKLKASVSFLKNELCATYDIDNTQICAGSNNGQDTCKGDSGGPLMIPKSTTDGDIKYYLIGIVSYGRACGTGSAIYTNVSSFIPWILKIIHL